MTSSVLPATDLPLTISDTISALRDGELTATALVEALIAKADRLDPELGCYLARTDEAALAAAAAADAELAAGDPVGPLHGIPLAVKDIIATADAPTTAQSLVLDPSFGARGDAPVVARLRAAGAVITGKVTTMEYAIGCPDPSKPFPMPAQPLGPRALDRRLELGYRQRRRGRPVPRRPRHRHRRQRPAARRLVRDQRTEADLRPGAQVRLRTARLQLRQHRPDGPQRLDCAIMLRVMAGHDESDACSVDRPVDDYVAALTGTCPGCASAS